MDGDDFGVALAGKASIVEHGKEGDGGDNDEGKTHEEGHGEAEAVIVQHHADDGDGNAGADEFHTDGREMGTKNSLSSAQFTEADGSCLADSFLMGGWLLGHAILACNTPAILCIGYCILGEVQNGGDDQPMWRWAWVGRIIMRVVSRCGGIGRVVSQKKDLFWPNYLWKANYTR